MQVVRRLAARPRDGFDQVDRRFDAEDFATGEHEFDGRVELVEDGSCRGLVATHRLRERVVEGGTGEEEPRQVAGGADADPGESSALGHGHPALGRVVAWLWLSVLAGGEYVEVVGGGECVPSLRVRAVLVVAGDPRDRHGRRLPEGLRPPEATRHRHWIVRGRV